MAELLKAREADIGSIRLVPSDGGRFEVTMDGELIFSKMKVGRHPEEGEILRLVSGKS
jgi:selenoprotein W-related protein